MFTVNRPRHYVGDPSARRRMNAPGKAVSTALAVCLLLVVSAFAAVTTAAVFANGPPSGSATTVANVEPNAAVSAPSPRTDTGVTCTVTVASENGGDNAVQTAIDGAAPGDTICVGAGVFPEQLTITTPNLTIVGAGNASTFIEPSAPLSLNTYDYDAYGGATSTPSAAIILVEGSSLDPTTGVSGVTIEDLAVDGANGASTFTGCGQGFLGVDFQASSGALVDATVTGIELPAGLFGCQQGLAVYAYDGIFNFPTTYHGPDSVLVLNSTVSSYDKNGVTCDDTGVTCSVTGNTIVGVGSTDLIAQNGVQIGFGADASVTANTVTGDAYAPTENVDYFSANEGNAACGILVYDGGNTVTVTQNTLASSTQAISVVGTASATVSYNTISSASAYGITFDLNASLAHLYYPVYSTDTPWTSIAAGNSIANANVGLLVYDDNVSVSGLSLTGVNVSVETLLDDASASYSETLMYVDGTSAVDGALLGNVSSFQATTGYAPKAIGSYDLVDDHFFAAGASYPSGAIQGILLNASSATVVGAVIDGFVNGIYVNPTIGSVTITASDLIAPTSFDVPTLGIWAGNLAPNPVTENAATVTITDNVLVGPGGATDSPYAGSIGILAGGLVVNISGNQIDDFSAVYGSVPTNTTGSGSGYDWYQGSQSVGVLVGCAPLATLASCQVGHNHLGSNAIGIAVLLSNLAFSGTWRTGPIAIVDNTITDSGGYGIWTEMPGSGETGAPGNGYGAPGSSLIQGNVIDDTLSGAPAMVLTGTNFSVVSNVLIGTSLTGDQGAKQVMAPSVDTASVEAVDEPLSGVTHVTLQANFFLDTSVYWSQAFSPPDSGSTLKVGELVSFTESGLPTSTPWTVALNGTSSTAVAAPTTIVAQAQNGSASFAAGLELHYTAHPASGTITIAGAPTSVAIAYGGASFGVTFTETGIAAKKLAHAGWTVVVNGTFEHSTGSSVTFTLPFGSVPFVVIGPTGNVVNSISGPVSGWTLSVTANEAVGVNFAPGKTANLAFHEKHLAKHTSWCVSVESYELCSSTPTIRFVGLTHGTYSYAIEPVAGESATATYDHASIALTGSLAVTKTAKVTVTFSASGAGLHGAAAVASLAATLGSVSASTVRPLAAFARAGTPGAV